MYSRRHNRYTRRSTASSPRIPGAVRELPPELMRRIDADPVFQVMTSDLQQWIDPYTGKAVPASLGRAQAAREYLIENDQLWKAQEPLPLARLEFERWRLDLIRLLPVEPRLRMFGRDGAWLNPYTGEFVPGISRDDGKINLHTVSLMAEHLCLTPSARGGRMLDAKTLQEKAKASRGTTSVFHKPQPLDEALEKASSVQRNMLPELPRLEGYELAVHYKAHHGVSGDFYDVITMPDQRVLIAVGDVTGHGLQAALVVATALKTLRFVARQGGSPAEVLVRFNQEIKPDLLPGQFITMFVATLDPRTGEVSCVRAGHHAALLVSPRNDVVLRRVAKSGMAIGLAQGETFAGTLREESLSLQPGDVLVQYTDGLVEAQDAQQREFGDARLCGSTLTHLEEGPQRLVDGIAEDVSRWAGGPVGDDLTIFALVAHASLAVPPVTGPTAKLTAEPTSEDGDDAEASAEEPGSPADPTPTGVQPHETGDIGEIASAAV
jgi:serine phosphatase RsbU (regulator of sigma subunit)